MPPKGGDGAAYLWLVAHQNYQGNECLMWPFSRATLGYGRFGYCGKMYSAHRFMCELVNGPPPAGRWQAAHSCGKGHEGCVHPEHLSWKNNRQNQLDRRKHGTTYGAKGNRTRFTPAQIAEIRSLKGIEPFLRTAERFGVKRGCIEYWQRTTHAPKPPGTSYTAVRRRMKKAELMLSADIY